MVGVHDDDPTADALFVAGALYQINGFLNQLAKLDLWRGDLASAGNRYRQISKEKRLKDLRDVIEHADEHIALDKHQIATEIDVLDDGNRLEVTVLDDECSARARDFGSGLTRYDDNG